MTPVRYPAARLLSRLKAHLRRGGVIAYPTESCYGLGCDPLQRRAATRLLRMKRRPAHKGLILIAGRQRELSPYMAHLAPAEQARLAATWPGPHTWVVAASHKAGPWLTGRHGTIAVRVTAHPEAAGLSRALRMALVSTSANRSGHKPLKTAGACRRAFGRDVLVLPGRVGGAKRPSTIHDLASGRILRR